MNRCPIRPIRPIRPFRPLCFVSAASPDQGLKARHMTAQAEGLGTTALPSALKGRDIIGRPNDPSPRIFVYGRRGTPHAQRLKPWRSAIGSWPCGHLRPIATDLNAQTRALAKATPRDQRAESPFAEPVPQVSQPAVSPISQSAGRSEVCRAQSPVPPDIRNSKLETRNPRNPPQSNRTRPFKPSRTRSLLPPA